MSAQQQKTTMELVASKAAGFRRRAGAARAAFLNPAAIAKTAAKPAGPAAKAPAKSATKPAAPGKVLGPPVPTSAPGARVTTKFFDDYPRFLETSKTSAYPWRLNLRYDAIFDEHRAIFEGATVLDIACHDGPWSLAALKTGAKSVIGIEGRPELVKHAEDNLAHYGYSTDQYSFVAGDIFAELAKQKVQVDVVLCLGFLYHTLRYNELMHRISECRPRHLIIDSEASAAAAPIVEVRAERIAREGNAVADEFSSGAAVVSGVPSEATARVLVEAYGYKVDAMSDWGGLIRDNPDSNGIGDYRQRRRFTMLCSDPTRA